MDTPAEAARMKARSEMMIALKCTVASWKVTQAVAAQRLGVTQPRLNDLLKGRLSKFSMDALFDLATAAGLRPAVTMQVAASGRAAVQRISRARKTAGSGRTVRTKAKGAAALV